MEAAAPAEKCGCYHLEGGMCIHTCLYILTLLCLCAQILHGNQNTSIKWRDWKQQDQFSWWPKLQKMTDSENRDKLMARKIFKK